MATGATGTPTPLLGIPTYATSVDPPNGTGFNSAMAFLDTLIATAPRSGGIGSLSAGDVPVWNGTSWIRPTGTRDGTKFLRDDGSWQMAGGAVPAGVIISYGGASAPSGWVLGDGTSYDTTTYAALFAIFGYAFGGAGANFNVPDLRGRLPVGKGTHADVDTLGENDGAALADRRPKHKTSVNESAHGHSINDPTHTHTAAVRQSQDIPQSGNLGGYNAAFDTNTGAAATGISIVANTTGITAGVQTAGTPLDTPSYIVLNYIIKT